MACYRGECLEQHPVFPEGSQAACKENARPADIHAPEIQYTKDDDEAIDEFTRRIVGTSWHSVSSPLLTRTIEPIDDPLYSSERAL